MTDLAVFLIAAAALTYAFWYAGRCDARARADRDFARRHAVRPCTERDGPRWTPDPSPRPLGDYDWRAVAEGDTQR